MHTGKVQIIVHHYLYTWVFYATGHGFKTISTLLAVTTKSIIA